MRKEITVQELKEKLHQSEDFIFIDVRETHEYEENNIGAQNIPLSDLLSDMSQASDDKNATIIIHCRSGQRSGMACDVMTAEGYKNVFNVLGGIQAWDETSTS